MSGEVRFGYTILYVPDVGEAIDFYERAFGLHRRFIGDDGEYGELDTGSTTLSFAAESFIASSLPGGFRRNDPAAPPPAVEIAFVTADVQAAYRSAVEAGARPLADPAAKPWGQTVAYVRDPHGFLIEIATPMS